MTKRNALLLQIFRNETQSDDERLGELILPGFSQQSSLIFLLHDQCADTNTIRMAALAISSLSEDAVFSRDVRPMRFRATESLHGTGSS
jgi:hypothetical protein